ncbi:anion permease [Alphaproteobacteria bacterium endosymbiont of Tiliacea citrago]|uniref:anion permease n=1 Tax=Alphaproteobacteria bacterium endosymbiont of Tiliacea citrago TaxID=3077944 RepID=UPI00313E553C
MNFLKKLDTNKIYQILFIFTLISSTSFVTIHKYKITVLFLFTISNFIFNFFDSGSMTMLSMTVGLLLKVFSTKSLLKAFCQPIIWQIMCFLFLSQALIKSGLARKVSIYIMYFFGTSTLSLSFGFCFLTVVFALVLPTSTARIGGIFIPIVASIFDILSKQDQKLKDTIIKVIVYSNTIASAMFFTASSGNFYIQEITKTLNVYISAQNWMLNGLFPGIVCLIATTFLIHHIMDPKTKNLKKINKKIEEEMIAFDSFSFNDFLILTIFISIFPFWFIAPILKIPFLGVLLASLFVFLFLDILNFEEDVLSHKEAWSLFFWMSNLLMLSSLITQYDSFAFLTTLFASLLNNIPANYEILFILIFYGYSQYFFASSTVHASALFLISFDLCIKYNYDPFFSALLLSYVSNLFAGLTTYSASEVILITKTFNCDSKEFNKYGLLFSSFIFVLWLISGFIWWKITKII